MRILLDFTLNLCLEIHISVGGFLHPTNSIFGGETFQIRLSLSSGKQNRKEPET